MKTEHEEYYQQGYWDRNKEIGSRHLIVINDALFELTEDQFQKFTKLYGSKTLDRDAHYEALDFIRDFCLCLNSNLKVFDY